MRLPCGFSTTRSCPQILTPTRISLYTLDLPLPLARDPESILVLRPVLNLFQGAGVVMDILLFNFTKLSWCTRGAEERRQRGEVPFPSVI